MFSRKFFKSHHDPCLYSPEKTAPIAPDSTPINVQEIEQLPLMAIPPLFDLFPLKGTPVPKDIEILPNKNFPIEGWERVYMYKTKIIGEGMTSAIYAIHFLEKVFAYKEFKLKFLLDNQESFYREYSILKDLNHENIIKTFGICCQDGIIRGFIMQLAKQDLLSFLKLNVHLPEYNRAKIALGIVNGIIAVHKALVLHRDIKPFNILMNGETPMISDFGEAVFADESLIYYDIELRTTYAYAAFSLLYLYLFNHYAAYNEKTEMWSVLKVFYTLITGFLHTSCFLELSHKPSTHEESKIKQTYEIFFLAENNDTKMVGSSCYTLLGEVYEKNKGENKNMQSLKCDLEEVIEKLAPQTKQTTRPSF